MCSPKFKWFTSPNHAPFRDGLPSSTHYKDMKGDTKSQKLGDME